MKKIIQVILIFSFFSCNTQLNNKQQCIQTSVTLLNYFKATDTTAIADLIGMRDLKSAGKSISFIRSECNNINSCFKKYGFPKTENFEYVTYPGNPIDEATVTIPIKDSISNLVKYKIEVDFAPANIIPHTKIRTYNFGPTLENPDLSLPLKNP